MLNERSIAELAADLEREFQHWEHIKEFGGSDPFYADGMGLNLTRNHIISMKKTMEQQIERENHDLTLFPASLPDIYYRETPPEMPYDYMARADEIRARAAEQLALYEQDPNFVWLNDHYKEVFSRGETRETKDAGLYPGQCAGLSRSRWCVEHDDLIEMRRLFRESYEVKSERWAETAAKMKAYLALRQGTTDSVSGPTKHELDDEKHMDEEMTGHHNHEDFGQMPQENPSLEEKIKRAQAKQMKQAAPKKPEREEQMSLF